MPTARFKGITECILDTLSKYTSPGSAVNDGPSVISFKFYTRPSVWFSI